MNESGRGGGGGERERERERERQTDRQTERYNRTPNINLLIHTCVNLHPQLSSPVSVPRQATRSWDTRAPPTGTAPSSSSSRPSRRASSSASTATTAATPSAGPSSTSSWTTSSASVPGWTPTRCAPFRNHGTTSAALQRLLTTPGGPWRTTSPPTWESTRTLPTVGWRSGYRRPTEATFAADKAGGEPGRRHRRSTAGARLLLRRLRGCCSCSVLVAGSSCLSCPSTRRWTRGSAPRRTFPSTFTGSGKGWRPSWTTPPSSSTLRLPEVTSLWNSARRLSRNEFRPFSRGLIPRKMTRVRMFTLKAQHMCCSCLFYPRCWF